MAEFLDISPLTDAELVQRCRVAEAEITDLIALEKQAEADLLFERSTEARDRLKLSRDTVVRAHREIYRLKSEMAHRLGAKLKAARLKRGLTVSEVAELARCPIGLATMFEQGKHPLIGTDFFSAISSGRYEPQADLPANRLFVLLLNNANSEL